MASDVPMSPELEQVDGEIQDLFRALQNGFQKIDKIKDSNRQSKQLEDLTGKMRKCKRLIKEFDRILKEEEKKNPPDVNKQLNDKKQFMIKELNSYVTLRKTYQSSLGNKRIELFDTGSDQVAEDTVQMASEMSNQELIHPGRKQMDQTDQAIERSKTVVAQTVEVGAQTAATLTQKSISIPSHFNLRRLSPFLAPLSLTRSPMASRQGDPWSEIVASDGAWPQIGVVYGRRRAREASARRNLETRGSFVGEQRPSFAPSKRTSWNRSLSIRGRESIFVAPGTNLQPQQKPSRALKRPPKPGNRAKKTFGGPPDFRKEKAYFEEVDAFELIEENPSPKNFGTWVRGMQQNHIDHDLPAILERWKISKLARQASQPLFDFMETPIIPSVHSNNSTSSYRTPEKDRESVTHSMARAIPLGCTGNSLKSIAEETNIISSFGKLKVKEEPIEVGNPYGGEALTAFEQLLVVCRQSAPVTLAEVFSAYGELGSIKKLGEGTYGEAYRAGRTVCKVVPFDGDLMVNGETQKKSEEVLEEVLLSLTLNNLRSDWGNSKKEHSCNGFIETKDFRVCRGPYDPYLSRAWEVYDAERQSENDHPKDFTNEQCYIVFVLADGGTDLESFAMVDYNEARSLLVQVTASLAVAEKACEFEHRDLHWGNILLAQDETSDTVSFIFQGKRMRARTFGLNVSIIDFTLSRINTGDAILFLDLSVDPALFEGPKRDKQAETYRKMKEITKECWEDSFPKTNVVWIIYLVDMVLQKLKSLHLGTKVDRELRSFKKRLASYGSAADCLDDPFFSDLLLDGDEQLSRMPQPDL